MLSEKALEAVFNRVMSAPGMPDNDDISYDRWFLDAALSALAEEGYVIEQGWQPIETAPSSDETVLVFGGRFSKPTAVLADGEYWRVNRVLRGVPTHWRPLPDPPAMVSKAEEPDQ